MMEVVRDCSVLQRAPWNPAKKPLCSLKRQVSTCSKTLAAPCFTSGRRATCEAACAHISWNHVGPMPRRVRWRGKSPTWRRFSSAMSAKRSEEHTSELQSRQYLVCRLLLEKKKKITNKNIQKSCKI